MSKSLHESNQKIELTEQKLTETTVEKDQLIKLLQDELKQAKANETLHELLLRESKDRSTELETKFATIQENNVSLQNDLKKSKEILTSTKSEVHALQENKKNVTINFRKNYTTHIKW